MWARQFLTVRHLQSVGRSSVFRWLPLSRTVFSSVEVVQPESEENMKPEFPPYHPPSQRWRWSNYADLPVQKVPPLKSTVSNLIKFSEAILQPHELQEMKKVVQEFSKPGGEAEMLQVLLEERAKHEENWLAEWWLDHAYLFYGFPLPVNVSPALSFPAQNFKGISDQIHYSAHLVEALLYFKHLIESKRLLIEGAGKATMDMSQFDLLFGTARIPGKTKDHLQYGCDSAHPVNHILVLRNGNIFMVPVYDNARRPLCRSEIAQQLSVVVEQSERKNADPVGILTAGKRADWAEIRRRLKDMSKLNRWLLDKGLFN